MSVTYNHSYSLNSNGAGAIAGTWQDVGSNDLLINQAIGANTTNGTTGITFNGANLQAVELVSNQPLTLMVNSHSSPFATITLVADAPFVWSASAGYSSNPLNVSVTEIYVTSTTACTLKGRALTT